MIDVSGKRVVLFGGSGFLASALIPRLIKKGVASILCVARNEGNLIKTRQQFGVDILSGDVADPCVVARAIDMEECRIVMNLAAFKHVGLAETSSMQCVRSNILGLMTLLAETIKQGVWLDAFLFVSTDKAAAPVRGVYGASKFIGERLVQEAARISSGPEYRIVRYGNILYSTGSVLCKWKDALDRGLPLTITDPNATRFYWSADQAVDLIFECFEKATDATPYLGTMKSVRMGDLLTAMIRKYGNGQDHLVHEIGLQPGENLHEILVESGIDSNQSERYTPEEIEGLI
jgi:UDP-N-acetylglucosamine 4,6-dehydratase/5-epimerase